MILSRFSRWAKVSFCLLMCILVVIFLMFHKPLTAEAFAPAIPIAAGVVVAAFLTVAGVSLVSGTDMSSAAQMVWDHLELQAQTAVANSALLAYGAGWLGANVVWPILSSDTVTGLMSAAVEAFGAESVPGQSYQLITNFIPDMTGVTVSADLIPDDPTQLLSNIPTSPVTFDYPLFDLVVQSAYPYVRLVAPDGGSFVLGQSNSQQGFQSFVSSSGYYSSGGVLFNVYSRMIEGVPCFNFGMRSFNGQSKLWFGLQSPNLLYIPPGSSSLYPLQFASGTGKVYYTVSGTNIFLPGTGAERIDNWMYNTFINSVVPYTINPASAWPAPPIAIPAEGDIAIPVPVSQTYDGVIDLAPDIVISTPANPVPGSPFDPDYTPPPDIPNLTIPALIFTKKFPFSIPYDLFTAFANLAVPAEPPQFQIPMPFSKIGLEDEAITVDFAQYGTLAAICRWGLSVAFIIGLVIITRKLIGAQ